MRTGRIWHTVAATHPTPGEARIVAFGGAAEILFSRYEVLISSQAGTVVISCGEIGKQAAVTLVYYCV